MLLELQDVEVFYGRIQAIKGLSFTVADGEVVTLIGANGAGKTTTLKTISGLRPVSAGRITFKDRDITRMPGLVPGIPLRRAQCLPKRDGRDKPGHDGGGTM